MQTQTISSSKKQRNLTLVIALLLLGFGLASLIGGATIGVLNLSNTDSEGYSLSPTYQVNTSDSTYAFVLGFLPYSQNSALTKWVVTPTGTDQTLFVGWAKINDALDYLEGTQFSSPSYWDWDYGAYSSGLNIPSFITINGEAVSSLPSSKSFWLDSDTSNQAITLNFDTTWDPTLGNRSLVIMNADGSPNVRADLQFGSKILVFSWLPYILVPTGSIMCIVGVLLLIRNRWAQVQKRITQKEEKINKIME